MTLFLGIDIGTSAVKACAMDAAGAVVASVDAPLALQTPFAGASEQDPNAWVAAVGAGAKSHCETLCKMGAGAETLTTLLTALGRETEVRGGGRGEGGDGGDRGSCAGKSRGKMERSLQAEQDSRRPRTPEQT